MNRKLRVGDRVNWLWKPPGGYGYAIPVAAIVERVHEKTCTILVRRKVRGEWIEEKKRVAKRFLSVRRAAN